jgi:hypothetical protein
VIFTHGAPRTLLFTDNCSMSLEEPLEDCTYGDPLVEKLVSFIAEEKFQRQFELFFLQHCRKFEQGEEHSLEYTKIYQEFEIMFQSRLQEFW